MSLTQALATSTAGLRTTQAALALIASNVANAETPGYVRKTLTQQTTSAGANGVSVRVGDIKRELDQYIQRQLRVETAGGSYARYARAILFAAAAGLRHARLRFCARDDLQQIHRCRAGADDQPGFGGGAQRGAERGAGSGAAAQRHDDRHPVAAQRRRNGPERFGCARQQRDAADRQHQSPACEHDRQ